MVKRQNQNLDVAVHLFAFLFFSLVNLPVHLFSFFRRLFCLLCWRFWYQRQRLARVNLFISGAIWRRRLVLYDHYAGRFQTGFRTY